jgi:isochorismate synthase EntC
VGGSPRPAALAAIRAAESFDRGWYAGPVGWVDGRGDGEFAVAIRSALIGAHDALLYAGGGIMGDSDPQAERAETEMKFATMLAALGLDG